MTDRHDVVERPTIERLPARAESTLAEILEAAKTGATPEVLREMLALRREALADLARAEYTRARAQLIADLPPWVKRDRSASYDGGKTVAYTYATLAAVIEAVTPAMLRHGFSSDAVTGMDGNNVTVTVRLTHRTGHTESASLSAPPDAKGSKSAPQAVASTVTYLRRHLLMALLGITTADADDVDDAPEGIAAPDKIDSARNLRAMADLVKSGKSREDVIAHVGKAIDQWTGADLDKLRAWIEPKAEPEAETESAPQAPPAPEAEEAEPSGLPVYRGGFRDARSKSLGKGKRRFEVTGDDGKLYFTTATDCATYLKQEGFPGPWLVEYDDRGESGREITQVVRDKEGTAIPF